MEKGKTKVEKVVQGKYRPVGEERMKNHQMGMGGGGIWSAGRYGDYCRVLGELQACFASIVNWKQQLTCNSLLICKYVYNTAEHRNARRLLVCQCWTNRVAS